MNLSVNGTLAPLHTFGYTYRDSTRWLVGLSAKRAKPGAEPLQSAVYSALPSALRVFKHQLELQS